MDADKALIAARDAFNAVGDELDDGEADMAYAAKLYELAPEIAGSFAEEFKSMTPEEQAAILALPAYGGNGTP